MKQLIIEKLHEIEKEENVKILLAVESGSRAWGFASPDSDYDVRFIYIRSQEDYLRLDSMRDVIERPINELLDINGWDLQKALRLMYKSNPTLFEWRSGKGKKIFLCIASVAGKPVDIGKRDTTADVIFRVGES